MLLRMSKYRNIVGDEYPARAYEKAAKIIASADILGDILEGKNMPKGIGKGIRDTIVEFITTGSVKELSELRVNPKIMALEKFEKIMGIGPVNALKFVELGYTTLEELARDPRLTKQQKIGIKYYDKIMQRVPRKIIEEVFEKIKDVIIGLDPRSTAIVSGSYRRGATTSGDVDILVRSDILSADALADVLNDDSRINGNIIVSSGAQKLMMLTPVTSVPAVGNMYVQVDIFVSKSDEYIAHLNYSTGSAAHNIRMRNAAIKKGLKLSQHGLFKGTQKINLLSEHDLYERLGEPFVEPTDRNE